MTRKGLAILAIVLTACSAAHAKGIFQAEGKIVELQRTKDTLTFRFMGKMSFGYATAADTHPKRAWKNMNWEATDILVQIGDWTQPHRPAEKADHPDVEGIYNTLLGLMKTGHSIQFSLDNPSFTFSNVGQLNRVSGTHIYAWDATR